MGLHLSVEGNQTILAFFNVGNSSSLSNASWLISFNDLFISIFTNHISNHFIICFKNFLGLVQFSLFLKLNYYFCFPFHTCIRLQMTETALVPNKNKMHLNRFHLCVNMRELPIYVYCGEVIGVSKDISWSNCRHNFAKFKLSVSHGGV